MRAATGPDGIRRGALALAIEGLASVAYQTLSSIRDQRRYPPPGDLVDIGGRRLHLWQAGQGTPSVVVIPALGAPAIEWARVQRALANQVTVYLYDRAGLGWSDPAAGPRTASRMATELHHLLVAADVAPPYVLVGHSMGGYVARLYAARHPDLAGMVLVDSSHEDQFERLAEHEDHGDRVLRQAARLALRPLGIRRATIDLGLNHEPRRDAARACPPDLVDTGIALALSSNHRRAVVQELLGFAPSAAEVRAEARHLGRLPLTVVIGGDSGRERLGAGWNAAWRDMQNELTQLSERGIQIVAEQAGHHVHHDDPVLITEAIRELVERLRGDRPDGEEPPA